LKINFYPLDFDYQVKDGQTYVYLFGRTEQGERLCVVQAYKPYFYVQINDIDKEELTKKLSKLLIENKLEPAKVTSWEEVEKELLGKIQKLLKIYVNYPKAVPLISRELSSWGIECYEKDILFVHRYLRDQKILPMTLVQVEGELQKEGGLRVPLFIATKIEQVSHESIPKLKMLGIDIETYAKDKIIDLEKNPILMLAFYGVDEKGEEFRKVITWKRFTHKLDYLEVVSDEAELINRFKQVIIDYQPDILTGYFSDGFDLPYIKHRADKYHIELDIGLDYSSLQTGGKADFKEGEASITGILHLDVCKFIRYIFGKNLKTDSYTLDAVAEELIGHKKHVVNLDNLAHVWDDGLKELNDYCEYNLHDAHLVLQLCQKLLYDMIEFTKIVGLPTYDVIRMRFSRLVENYILKRDIEYNVLAPNKPVHEEVDQRMEETFQGAFVYEPIPGLYKDIIVFDFRSLYPSIITAHNIGPESFHCDCCKNVKEARVPTQDEYWFCNKEKKFIPTVLEQLISIRADLKKQIKEAKARKENTTILEARSWGIKTLANSFYGYLGFFGARWYCIECARSTTAYARNYILTTISKAEEVGFKVIYSDTDSLFVLLGEQGMEKALKFQKEINSHLPGQMELELESYYPRGIFVAAKGASDKGAKKRYALISKEGKLKITGFEMVRRNSSLIAKEVQEQVLRMVLEDKTKEAFDYAQKMIVELKAGKISLDKLIIKTQITKELKEYSSIAPHVAIAWQMIKKGERIAPGSVVQYVICKGSGLVRDRAKLPTEVKDYDAEYYLNNQVLPAISSIFAVLGYSEEELTKRSSQIGLGKFF
jgi:DNA polymerase elongation subunit (family B)